MSNFVPSPGTYFYMQIKPWDRIVESGSFGEATVVKQHDRSYQDEIFFCTARDGTHIVSQRVFGGYNHGNKSRLDKIEERIFQPVGPDVLRALASELRPVAGFPEQE